MANANGHYVKILQYLKKSISGPVKVLDLGCGPGISVLCGQQEGIEVTGLDFTPSLIPIWKNGRVNNTVIADACVLPFKDNSFHVVTALDILEHIPEDDLDNLLEETKRVCMSRGQQHWCICLTDEEFKFGGYQLHITIRNAEWWLKRMLKHGLEMVQASFDKSITHIIAVTRLVKEC